MSILGFLKGNVSCARQERRRMDIQRVTSSLLGFPLVLIIFLLGNKIVVDIALVVIAILSMSEYFNAITKIAKPVKWLGYLSCASIAFIHVIPQEYLNMVVTLSVPTILIILFSQVIATDMKTTFKDIAYTFIGIFYVVFFIMFVAFINGMPNGMLFLQLGEPIYQLMLLENTLENINLVK